MDKESKLKKEIEEVINRNSRENASNTPDFILAQYLMSCLAAFEAATNERERWYGRDQKPCSSPTVLRAPQLKTDS